MVATCRNPDKSADQLQLSGSTTHLLPCDISNDESIEACVKAIQALGVHRVDLLINNAGVSNKDHPDDPADKVDRQEMVDIYNTNVAGPMAVTKVMAPLMEASPDPVVINISSRLGSISSSNRYYYFILY